MLEPRPCAHGPCTLPARSAQAHLHHRFDSNVNWLAVAVQARRSALAPYPSARCASVPVPSGVWRYISPFCALCGRVRSSRTPRSSAPTRPTSSCAPASLWRLSPRAPAAKSRHRRRCLDASLAPGAWRLGVPPRLLPPPAARTHPGTHPAGRHVFCNFMGLPDFGGVPSHPHARLVATMFVVGLGGFIAAVSLDAVHRPALFGSLFWREEEP